MKRILFSSLTFLASLLAFPFAFVYGGFGVAMGVFRYWRKVALSSDLFEEEDDGEDTEKKVLDFIKRRFPTDCNWTSGNCYFFALILKDAFGGTILYDEIQGHFLCEIDGIPYDFNGVYENKDGFLVEWDELRKDDPLYSSRIIRDCCR